MKSISNKIIAFCLGLLVTFVVTSCSSGLEDPVTEAGLQADGEAPPGMDPTCIDQELREFPLTPIDVLDFETQADIAFSLQVPTGPYTKDSCLCRVNHYDILFQPTPILPAESLITVTGRNGVEIAFSVVADHAPLQTIRVDAPEELDGSFFDIYIDFENENNFEVQGAGGLCIIDNLDATEKQPYDGLLFYSPLGHTIPSLLPGGEPIKELYIPTNMTE